MVIFAIQTHHHPIKNSGSVHCKWTQNWKKDGVFQGFLFLYLICIRSNDLTSQILQISKIISKILRTIKYVGVNIQIINKLKLK